MDESEKKFFKRNKKKKNDISLRLSGVDPGSL